MMKTHCTANSTKTANWGRCKPKNGAVLCNITSELPRRTAVLEIRFQEQGQVERDSRLELKWILRRKGKVNKGGTAGIA